MTTSTAATSKAQPTLTELTLPVGGMTCAACVSHVETALKAWPGVGDVAVNLMTRSARVAFDPARADAAALVEVVNKAGYFAELPSQASVLDQQQGLDHELADEATDKLRRAIIAIIAGAAVMTGSMVWHHQLPAALWIAIGVVGVIATGGPIASRAWSAARAHTTDMNTLVVLGVLASLLGSAFGDIYVDAALFIVGFVLLGQSIEARARRRTTTALSALAALRPTVAHRQTDDGSIVELALDQVRRGDLLVVRPGERVPADGRVKDGVSHVDESLLTGEPQPLKKQKGDSVAAGTTNQSQALTIEVTRTGDDSTLSRLLRLLRDAQAQKAPTQRLADRVAAIFVPVILVIAAITFGVWFFVGSVDDAIVHAVAVLVIACPCAMGLAVPTAVMVATGKAAQQGVLIKGGEVLERAATIDAVIFDKTGTLTLGRPAVVDVAGAGGAVDLAVVARALAVERASEHPLARAVAAHPAWSAVPKKRAKDTVVVEGGGLTGVVEGTAVAVGNRRLGFSVDDDLAAAEARFLAAGHTVVFFAEAGVARVVVGVADPVRDEARDVVAGLAVPSRMLTGDQLPTAERVARDVGVGSVDAGLLPADKVRIVKEVGGHVMVVGDGVNDAAALAAAWVGVAMGSGAEVAVQAADVALLRGDLRGLLTLVHVARGARRVMRQNLLWAFGYNVVMVPVAAGALAFAGLELSPMLASAAMALSSVSVVANSLRLQRS